METNENQKILDWLIQRFKSMSKLGKGISIAGLAAIVAALLLCCGCGTVGWISSKDTSSATISIQNAPTTTTDMNTNLNTKSL